MPESLYIAGVDESHVEQWHKKDKPTEKDLKHAKKQNGNEQQNAGAGER